MLLYESRNFVLRYRILILLVIFLVETNITAQVLVNQKRPEAK